MRFCVLSALVSLISRPVLAGFTAAAGITIAATQVPKMFHIAKQDENPILNVVYTVMEIDQAHIPSVLSGFGSLAVMIICKKFFPKYPGLLLGLLGAGLVSYVIYMARAGEPVSVVWVKETATRILKLR